MGAYIFEDSPDFVMGFPLYKAGFSVGREVAVAIDAMPARSYVVVPTTFEAGVASAFVLRLYSSEGVALERMQ